MFQCNFKQFARFIKFWEMEKVMVTCFKQRLGQKMKQTGNSFDFISLQQLA